MNTRNSKSKNLFVTVGSTKFEDLIDKLLTPDILKCLKSHSFNNLKLQCGNGHHVDKHLDFSKNSSVKFTKEGIKITAYQYKPSIKEDLESADLVISHAGAGSVLESLDANKKLIVVVNEGLMDNHQLELAEQMFEEGYLLYTNCDELEEQINLINEQEMTKYVPGNPKLFGKYISKMFS